MSIVKGASGLLQVQANLITSPTYTFAVWLKSVGGEQGFGSYFNYINAAGNNIQLWDPFPAGIRHSVTQSGGGSSVTTGTAITANTWFPAVCPSTSGRSNSIQIPGNSVTAGGIYGVFVTPSSPTLNLMAESSGVGDIPTGDKIGGVAIYAATLNQADIDHILAGGDLNALPSTTAPVEYWIDSEGVAKDGSNNLTSWTGQVSGTVLTPSGTVTVDDADLAPIANTATGPSITPSDPVVDGAEATITTSGLSGAITATLGGYSITTAGTLPNLTYTLDIASITANGPVSAPRIGESLTLSVTGDEGTATSTVATQAAAGMAAITLAGTLANETDSLIDGMQSASGLTVAVGDIMYYPTADNTSIAATGALTTDSESFTLILIQGGSATTAGNAYAFTVTPEAVTPVGPQGDWPFSKGIKPTATETWTWGARHPLTGMRVRKFNG